MGLPQPTAHSLKGPLLFPGPGRPRAGGDPSPRQGPGPSGAASPLRRIQGLPRPPRVASRGGVGPSLPAPRWWLQGRRGKGRAEERGPPSDPRGGQDPVLRNAGPPPRRSRGGGCRPAAGYELPGIPSSRWAGASRRSLPVGGRGGREVGRRRNPLGGGIGGKSARLWPGQVESESPPAGAALGAAGEGLRGPGRPCFFYPASAPSRIAGRPCPLGAPTPLPETSRSPAALLRPLALRPPLLSGTKGTIK